MLSKISTSNKVMFAIALGPFFSLMSIGVVNVSLPSLAIEFDESIDTIRWVSISYLISLPVFIPIMSKLSDKLGYVSVHNYGIVIFGLASIFLVLSPTVVWLAIFRGLQGLGAAMFQATNIVIISIYYPPHQRGKMLGIIGTSVALGSMVGPGIGGILITFFPWQLLFMIHVPLIIVCVLFAFKYIKLADFENKVKVDIAGAVIFSALIMGIMVLIVFYEDLLIFRWIIIPLISLIILLLIIFIRHINKVKHPFIDIKLLKNKKVTSGIFIAVISFIITFSILAVMPFHLETILNLNPIIVGLVLITYSLMLAISGPVFGSLSDLYGAVRIILIGFILMFVALVALYIFGKSNMILIITSLAVLGAGMGMVTSPNYSMVMTSSPKESMGMVGGLIALGRTIGMAAGTVLGLTVMNLWIPDDIADITVLLINKDEELLSYGLKGYKSVYISMAIVTLMGIILSWNLFKKESINKSY